jgi:hypothetical protein
MSLSYHDICAAVAIAINALEGTDPVELQVIYSQRPLTVEVFDSSIFPFNAIRDRIIEAEGKLAQQVSKSTDRVLRSYIGSQTVPLVSGDELPTLDENGVAIIGNFGACIDATNPLITCTPQPLPVVRRRSLAPTLWLLEGAMFALDGTRVFHSQESVILECCIYNASTQLDAFDADEAILFPDSMAVDYVSGALALLVRDDEFLPQATQYGQYYLSTLTTLPAGVMEGQPV